jgi:hypothetical protein
MLVPILEDEGLFDERPCEARRRAANAEYFCGKPLIIRELTRHEARE